MLSKSDIEHRFESAEACVSEASEGLATFKARLSEFALGNKASIISDPNPKTGNVAIKLRFPKFSKELRRKAYSIVTHARHSLDQAVYAATICLDGKTRGSNTYFPFAKNPDDFDTLFAKRGRCQHVSPRIIPTLKGFEPWYSGPSHSGGDDFLRYLGKISGPNKHQVGLYPIPHISELANGNIYFEYVCEAKMPPEHISGTNDFVVAVVPRWSNFKYEADISFGVSLSEPSKSQEDAVSDLSKMIAVSNKIVITIKDFVVTELV